MQQLFHALSKIQLGLGVVEGLVIGQTGGNLTCTAGQARVGALASDTPTNKAEYGMNRPGRVIEVASAPSAVAPIANGLGVPVTQLVWLKTDGTLLVTRDRNLGESYADVVPNGQLQEDPFKGSVLKTLELGNPQGGPIRGLEPACVLLAKITVAASSSTISAIDNTVKTRVLT